MSGHHLDDDLLRRAFESLAGSTASQCTEEDLDRVWLAVNGYLFAAGRRNLVERLGTNPALAEAWRVAHELQRSLPVAVAGKRHEAWWSASWLAAAAVLMLAVTAVFVVRGGRPPDDTTRDAGRYTIESRVTRDALPRDAFRLRWSPALQDARYQVRVTTEDLRVLTTAADLTEPELVVDRDRLADVMPGARVFWQVEVTLANGERETSPTFVVRVK